MTERTEPVEPAESPQPVEPTGSPADERPDDDGRERGVVPGATFIGQPAKVMRIGTMVKGLLEEVRSAPLDEAARGRLADVHERTLRELEDGLSPDLVDELRRISLPFADDDAPPSDAELRVAQAQLVGWLEGLFHGLQTALVAQQMSTQAAQARRALPPGVTLAPGHPGQAGPGAAGAREEDGAAGRREERHPGQYL